MRIRRLALLFAVRLAPLIAVVAAPTAAGAHALPVLGFQEDSSSTRSIDRSAAALATVGVDGVELLSSGRAVGTPLPVDVRQLAAAHRDHLKAVLLVSNFDDSIGDFSERLAHRLLGNPAAIAAVASSLATFVASEGWDGVNVDLESLTPRDTAGLVNFVTALRTDLDPARQLTIDVSNNTSAAQFAANGYNLGALGQIADTLVLMAYDQHDPWDSGPGPIGSLSWTRAGLAVVKQFVPPTKIDLGVAGYGYAWRPHDKQMLSDAQTRALVKRFHARARWSRSAGEWTARLGDGSVLWWSDARSFAVRARLAAAQRLHGLAVWSLGLSDQL